MSKGYYLYCIVSKSVDLSSPGLELISGEEVQALVEEVDPDEFSEGNISSNPAWLETKVLKHHEIVELVAARWTTIPMKFGAIFENKTSLHNMLREKGGGFKKLLFDLADKEEWAVKVFCNRESIKDLISGTDPEIKELNLAAESKPLGAAYFLKRKLEEKLEGKTNQLIEESSAQIYKKIEGISVYLTLNQLQSREVTQRKEEMILNAACLIEKKKLEDFRVQISNIEGKEFQIETSGPHPPYSFVNWGEVPSLSREVK